MHEQRILESRARLGSIEYFESLPVEVRESARSISIDSRASTRSDPPLIDFHAGKLERRQYTILTLRRLKPIWQIRTKSLYKYFWIDVSSNSQFSMETEYLYFVSIHASILIKVITFCRVETWTHCHLEDRLYYYCRIFVFVDWSISSFYLLLFSIFSWRKKWWLSKFLFLFIDVWI